MASHLCHLSIFHDDNPVHFPADSDSVRDYYCGFSPGQFQKQVQNLCFRHRIQGRRGLIQQQDIPFAEHAAGQSQSLPLASGKGAVTEFFSQHHLPSFTVGQICEASPFQKFINFRSLFQSLPSADSHIFSGAQLIPHKILKQDGHISIKIVPVCLLQLLASITDFPARRLINPQKQPCQCGFSASVLSHDGHRLIFSHGKRNAAKCRSLGAGIRKTYLICRNCVKIRRKFFRAILRFAKIHKTVVVTDKCHTFRHSSQTHQKISGGGLKRRKGSQRSGGHSKIHLPFNRQPDGQ